MRLARAGDPPMSLRIAVSLLVLAALAPLPLHAEKAGQTTLVLRESAEREVEQDTLVATLAARAQADSARAAQAAVNDAMSDAVEAARATSGVRAATGGYRVHREHDRDGQPRGWVAEQDLRLTSREAARLLELAGELQDAGLVLRGLAYTLGAEARRALRDELAVEAIEALRRRAEIIAETLAMRVEAIGTLRVGGAGQPPPVRPMFEARAAADAAMAPPTALPDLETVSVEVEAEIRLVPR